MEIIGGGRPTRGHTPKNGYRVACSCGWSQEPLRSGKDCEVAFTDHVNEVAAGKCTKCGEPLEGNSITRRPRVCSACAAIDRKRYRDDAFERDPDLVRLKAKRATIKSKYGMSLEDLDLLILSQHSKCAICNEALIVGTKTGLHVDHCHETGFIRGLLCSKCNQGLGLFGDDPVRLRQAIIYLDRIQNLSASRLMPGFNDNRKGAIAS